MTSNRTRACPLPMLLTLAVALGPVAAAAQPAAPPAPAPPAAAPAAPPAATPAPVAPPRYELVAGQLVVVAGDGSRTAVVTPCAAGSLAVSST